MVGKTLGHYEILEPLGAGGMGEVYRARDTTLGRDVAVKLIADDIGDDPSHLARFEREARLLASLNHPHIATIHGLENEQGVRFLVMELVAGTSLSQKFREGRLPANEALVIASQIAQALEAAHRERIVHRDLKPDNVLLTADGQVKLVDFGIAKADTAEPEPQVTSGVTSLTETGTVVGTPTYMSPEQIRGQPVDHRTDIWAFGCLLFEALTGSRAFGRETLAATYSAIVSDEPDWARLPESTAPELRSLLRRCLTKDRNRRPGDIRDARLEIEDVLQESGIGVPGAVAGRRVVGASWSLRVGVAVGLVAFGIAAVWAWTSWEGGATPARVEGPLLDTVSPLTTSADQEFAATISPDGEWFVFVRRDGDEPMLYLQNVGGSNPISLDTVGVSPSFSPDGDYIAFSEPPESTYLTQRGGGIRVMRITGENKRELTETGFNPSWSSDGDKIVYGGEYADFNPYRRHVDRDLSIVDVDSQEVVTLGLGDAAQPSWSPNGHRIAYWEALTGQRDIWTIAPDGADPRRVTEDAAFDANPIWSPDGQWLYWTSTRGGVMGIWRVPIDEVTGEVLDDPEQIKPGGATEPAMLSFSADGTRLLLTEVLVRSRVLAADFDPEGVRMTSAPVTVIDGSRAMVTPVLSPDGNRLVYRTWGAPQNIYVSNIDGSNEVRVTEGEARDWTPQWSPDGERIIYYSNASSTFQVWTINPDGTGAERLTDFQEAPLRPLFSPDGSKIIFGARGDTRARIFDATSGFADRTFEELPRAPGRDDLTFFATGWREGDPAIVGEAGGAFTYSLETGEYEMLVDSEARWPRWLADGRRVIYHRQDPFGVFVVDRVTKDSWKIEGILAAEAVFLSPDNRRIYWLQQEARSDIWKLELRQR